MDQAQATHCRIICLRFTRFKLRALSRGQDEAFEGERLSL